MNEDIDIEKKIKNMMEELHALKAAKTVGLLLNSYSWDSGDSYNWQNKNYKIVFGNGQFPVITHFNSLGTISVFTPSEENGSMVQIFNFQQGIGQTDRIVITSTRPIISVSEV